MRLTIALLLPLMVLRTLLPAGFMPVAENGTLRIVMCSEGLLLPATVNEEGSGKHPASSDTGSCVFAHSAAGAPPVLHAIAALLPPAEFRFFSAPADDLPPATGPPRAAAARAPPTLS